MAELQIRLDQIRDNILKLDAFLHARGLTWTLVLKVLGGDEASWKPLLDGLPTQALRGLADSRLEHLETFKAERPGWTTWQIRPPSLHNADRIVRSVDISLNSSLRTLRALNEAAGRAGRRHDVVLMLELGENREGFPPEILREAWPEILALRHLRPLGLGANLGCLYGVEPTAEKLAPLAELRDELEAAGDLRLPLLSGGSSINLPLIASGRAPAAINHYRLGEAVFFGTSPYDNQPFLDLHTENFLYSATVLEVHDKDPAPVGRLVPSAVGTTLERPDVTPEGVQALVDFGLVDTDPAHLTPLDARLRLVGSTSDMTLLYDPEGRLRVGDRVLFRPSYMGVAQLMPQSTVQRIKKDPREKE